MRYLKNQVKQKLRSGQSVIGSWINLPCLETVEIMARMDFDFLVVDEEHTSLNFETIQKMAMVMEGYGKPPYIRVSENDPGIIKKALDAGYYGIIVPMINSKKEAQKAVESVFYPPQGKRGVGLSRAQGYGTEFEVYKKWYEKNISLVAQIEHVQGIANLEDILSIDELDATMIGPYDLSASLGHPGEFQRQEVKKELEKYERISKKMQKPYGQHIVQLDHRVVTDKVKKGYQFLAYGIDELFFARSCQQELNLIKQNVSIKS